MVSGRVGRTYRSGLAYSKRAMVVSPRALSVPILFMEDERFATACRHRFAHDSIHSHTCTLVRAQFLAATNLRDCRCHGGAKSHDGELPAYADVPRLGRYRIEGGAIVGSRSDGSISPFRARYA